MINNKGLTTKGLLLIFVVLAVVVVLLLLFFNSEKKRNFISDAQGFINGVRQLATEDVITLPSTKNETIIVSVSQINPKSKLQKSAFNEYWVKEKSYIVIKNSGSEYSPVYDYYISLEDEGGNCLEFIKEKELHLKKVKKKCNIDKVKETGAVYYKN